MHGFYEKGFAGLVLIAGLSACGGGGGDSPAPANNSTNTNTNVSSTNTFVAWSPSAGTLAAKKTVPGAVFDTTGLSFLAGNGCTKVVGANTVSTTVYEQANSLVYAATDVTEAGQQEVAEFVEAAIVTLKTQFGIAAAAPGINGAKVRVCVQNEFVRTGSPAEASDAKAILATSPSGYFSAAPGGRAGVSLATKRWTQDSFHELMAHEVSHLFVANRLGSAIGLGVIPPDTWFSEGVAEYLGWGGKAVGYSVDQIVAKINTTNPITVTEPAGFAGSTGLNTDGYYTSAAVVAYLFSPTGANNPSSVLLSLLDRIKTEWQPFRDACVPYLVGTPPPVNCPLNWTESQLVTKRQAIFTTAFEANFKEKDGTAMKLRTGTNNLQDTVAARIRTWW
jgi:hypothetical protein